MDRRDRAASGETLTPGRFVDSEHPVVKAFATEHCGSSNDPRSQMVALYYAVRDGFRYSPYGVAERPEEFYASSVLQRPASRGAHCIDKANVLAACARAVGVHSRLHFANVRNHIGTDALEKQLGTDLLVFHGYVELFIGGRWVAATPAFNRGLCEKLGVAPLEFDGVHDSIFQPFDPEGARFMEYVHDYGSFDDLPYDLMLSQWRTYYPTVAKTGRWPDPPSRTKGS